MIRNFTEQSANERTFLAWVRTGIAVIAFGFVVEKFNLFILALATTAAGVGGGIRTERLTGPLGRYDGLALMLVGVILIVIGDFRFARNTRLINDAGPQAGGVRTELFVTTVLVLLVTAYCVSILVG
ncbi:MAG: DUF202 domain-containing protein [Pseudomonadota bacterium]|nr:DUF202 domain-containing protein [Pseudomonadota bacterium]